MARSNNIEALKAWIKKNGAWNNSHTSYVCLTCNKSFFGPPSDKSKFCSRKCHAEYRKRLTGSLAMNWKGGRSMNNKCVDCQKRISLASTRCKSCAARVMQHTQLKQRPWLRTPEVIKKALRRRSVSSLEEKFQKIIDKYQLPYKYVGNGGFFIERKNPDFININGEKKAIEVYARKHKEKMRDVSIERWKEERRQIFAKYGWKIIFFDEVQLNSEENVLSALRGGASYS